MAEPSDAVGPEAMDSEEAADESHELADTDETRELTEADVHELHQQQLETRLEMNPYSYEDHIALLAVLRDSRKFEELRKARERLTTVFPLTEDLWVQWLKDELERTPEDRRSDLASLFDRAAEDYIAPKVWLMYLEFASKQEGLNGADQLRDLYEKAVAQCGQHVAEGGKIWLSYIKFEESNGSKEERVLDLYARVLRIPLLESETLFALFEERYSSHPDFELIRQSYKEAEEQRRGYIEEMETLLSGSTEDRAALFKKYIEVERANKAPVNRVKTLYERAVAMCALDDSVWANYVLWLRTVDGDDEKDLLAVIDRALRNVPWSGEIWKQKMRVLMKFDHSLDEIRDAMTNAMNSGVRFATEHVSLWMTYVNALHRALKAEESDTPGFASILQEFRSACQQASEFLPTIEGVSGDDLDEIFKYQASVEASLGFMDVARSIWGEILAPRNNPRVSVWLDFICLERLHGDPKHVRKAFTKALSRSLERDLPILCSAYRRFEMETGTVDHMDSADADFKKYMAAHEQWKKSDEAKKAQKPDQQKKNQKQKSPKKAGHEKQPPAGVPGKKRKAASDEPEPAAKAAKVDFDGFKVPALPGGAVGAGKGKQEEAKQAANKPKEGENDDMKVFLSNLDYTTSEEDILSFAGDLRDAVESVDVVKDKLGKSRGFAYVLMKSTADAQEFFKKDRQNLKGRPAFVSPCQKGEKRKPVFKYAAGREEPNKLFVSNLHLDVTNEDLVEKYSKFGALVSARIVTYRNGHSKGIAYVEFEDEAHAKRALLETDGMDIKGKEIQVAISNAPMRRGGKPEDGPGGGPSKEPRFGSNAAPLGGGTRGPSAAAGRGGRRTQVALVPRAVQVPRDDKSSSNGHKEAKMSNADFRSMLLGKK